ncbi:aminoglycoside phosphotransferase family protein [Haliea sp. E1-2-M8]|uniref:aminoglycoside phosphotransferase family protein n=1 Tax=Haliea sp. E1-2-M8 TaxID=3064706 RepID=UPI00271EDAEA|nr:aminoglycoside phosphotransferase family protein [Haliea sp. E1-2-M8]MDO8863395.1 aminoglycoside phosphotransferase family protein [Haliea sp. E1-2-M8]
MITGRMQVEWQGALARHFGSDLNLLLQQFGAEVVHAEELTRLVSRRQRKAVFKLKLADGRLLKARRFRTGQEVVLAAALAPLLDGRHYSRVLANLGTSTLEEWRSGTVLAAEAVTTGHARKAGELLGRLHMTTGLPGPEAAPVLMVAEHLGLMQEHLAALLEQGVLASSDAASLLELALGTMPAHFEAGLIHGDFCIENMVVSSSGELVLIDNESMCVGPLDFDIARAWCRWPMTTAARAGFVTGYTQFRGLESFTPHCQFWAIRALLMSVYVHLKHERPCQPAVTALKRLAAGAESGYWASLAQVER